ncbi:MAG: M3 family metallopeptidase, partial [Burkholderiales bacterium]|nr:M3 family metallopeptidase [Burkholderiales bacterium]
MNPLLDFSGLPRFAQVKPADVTPAVDQLLAENRALLARVTDDATPATWPAFVAPLEDANERLSRAWGTVGHLHGVLDSPELREAYNENQPKLVQYWTELGQNERLFAKYKTLAASPEFATLSPAQQRILENEIRDFRLSGAELPPAEKKRFAEIMEALARLSTEFSEHLLDATNAFALYIGDAAALAGIPEDALEAARESAAKDGNRGWKFTLQAPSYLPVMQYADNRALREVVYRAYVTRASEEYAEALAHARGLQANAGGVDSEPPAEQAVAGWNNTPLIGEILKLRREAARLLGYASHAEVSLVPKMAEKPEQVLAFLNDLADKALPFARRDYAELADFARKELGLPTLEAWDVAYASEKLRARRYAFSSQEVKQYFPEPKVLDGMFRVVETIYGVKIERDEAETWDPGVRFFRIVGGDGKPVGRFYLDPYARE